MLYSIVVISSIWKLDTKFVDSIANNNYFLFEEFTNDGSISTMNGAYISDENNNPILFIFTKPWGLSTKTALRSFIATNKFTILGYVIVVDSDPQSTELDEVKRSFIDNLDVYGTKPVIFAASAKVIDSLRYRFHDNTGIDERVNFIVCDLEDHINIKRTTVELLEISNSDKRLIEAIRNIQ